MKTYKMWRVIALLRNDRGEEVWVPLTAKLPSKRSAQNVADRVWLETRIEECQVDKYGEEV